MPFTDTPFPRRNTGKMSLLLRFWHYVLELFSPFGVFFWPSAGFLVLVSLLLPYTPSRLLAVLLVELGLLELCAVLIFRPRLNMERETPPRVRVNSEFSIRYRLVSRSRLSAFDLELDPQLGCNGLRWTHGVALPRIRPGATETAVGIMRAEARGVYRAGRATAQTGFPFGMFRPFCRSGESFLLHVHPDYTPLEKLDLPLGKRFQSTGLSRIAKIGEAADFHSCREFRSGDNPRHVDWHGSARQGRLIVREFQEEYLTRAAILLDTKLPGRRDGERALESALRITAAATEFLMRDECVVDLFVAGKTVRRLETDRRQSSFDAVLDLLAEINGATTFELGTLENEVMSRIHGVGCALIVLLDADAERRRLVERVAAQGCQVKTLLIADVPPPETPEHWQTATPTAIDNGSVKIL